MSFLRTNLILAPILVLILVSFFSTNIIAADDVSKQAINPDSVYFPFKRAWEKFRLKIALSDQQKIEYENSLLKNRFEEINYIVLNKLLGEYEKASERFSYQAGIITESIQGINKEKEKEKEKLLISFNWYKEKLAKLRDQSRANSSYWLLIQQNIDTLNILSNKLKES